jgi:molybdopterin-binding protein
MQPRVRHHVRVPTYRITEAAAVLGVSDDTLRRWADGGRVATHRDAEGRLRIEGDDLAGLARELAEHGPPGLSDGRRAAAVSARNRMRGVVTRVVHDTVMAQVELVCGPYRVVSLMSSEAARELGLEPGVIAVASVKSTNVVVELP